MIDRVDRIVHHDQSLPGRTSLVIHVSLFFLLNGVFLMRVWSRVAFGERTARIRPVGRGTIFAAEERTC